MSRVIFIRREEYWEAAPFADLKDGDEFKVFDFHPEGRKFSLLPSWVAYSNPTVAEIQAYQKLSGTGSMCTILEK